VTRLLFVYGSLRAGQDNDEARALAAGSSPLGAAYVYGALMDLQGHAALQPTGSGRGRVNGELVLIRDEALWTRLDAYEGVGEPGWYVRGLVVAIDAHGQPRSAWAYVAPTPGPAV
jgi:gamma-glutamylcyclotransferase (GGCT)/AIG2-like uncharacterized protein YtfP